MRVLPPPTFIPNYTKIPDTIKSEKYFYPKPETELQNPVTSTDNGLEDPVITPDTGLHNSTGSTTDAGYSVATSNSIVAKDTTTEVSVLTVSGLQTSDPGLQVSVSSENPKLHSSTLKMETRSHYLAMNATTGLMDSLVNKDTGFMDDDVISLDSELPNKPDTDVIVGPRDGRILKSKSNSSNLNIESKTSTEKSNTLTQGKQFLDVENKENSTNASNNKETKEEEVSEESTDREEESTEEYKNPEIYYGERKESSTVMVEEFELKKKKT